MAYDHTIMPRPEQSLEAQLVNIKSDRDRLQSLVAQNAAASTKYAGRAYNTVGGQLISGGAANPNLATKSFDYLGRFGATGIYTAFVKGLYEVKYSVGGVISAGAEAFASVIKNGVVANDISRGNRSTAATSQGFYSNGSDFVELDVNETLRLQAYSNGTWTLETGIYVTFLAVRKI